MNPLLAPTESTPQSPRTRPSAPPAERLVLPIDGLHCASCVAAVERAIGLGAGVRSVAVNLATAEAVVEHSGASRSEIARLVHEAGYEVAPDRGPSGAAARALPAQGVESGLLRRLLFAVAGTMAVKVLASNLLPLDPLARFAGAALVSLAVLGYSGGSYYRGLAASVRRRAADMNTLVATGTSAAFLLSLFAFLRPALAPPGGGLYLDTAAMIIALLLVGRLIEARARRRALSAVAELSALAAPEARVLRDGEERLVPIESVRVGEEVLVGAGETVPVDGEVVAGNSAVDESLVSGESLPVARGPGDPVVGGSINGNGRLRVRVSRTGEATTLAAIVRAVESAQARKAPIQRIVDRVAGVFVPVVFLIAIGTVAAWAWGGGESALAKGLVRGVAVLMMACPCALGLATPMALLVGTGRAARDGILFRDGEALERAARLEAVIFDKTGTLTSGRPEVISVEPRDGWSGDEVIAMAAAVEAGSGHPLGDAIIAHARARGLARGASDAVCVEPGMGVIGSFNGKEVLVGSRRFLKARGVEAASAGDGAATVWVALGGDAIGSIRVADRTRSEAPEAIEDLRRLGVSSGMMTGDDAAVAEAIGAPLGLEPILAGRLPVEKAAAVAELGPRTAMVGDGINDAPALAQADVGFAMAGGTDVARAASAVTLVRPDLRLVPAAIRLARRTQRVIAENLGWAFVFNLIGIPFAAGLFEKQTGFSISPAFAAFAMAMSSVLVTLNSLRLRARRVAPAAATAVLALGALLAPLAPIAPNASAFGDNPFDVEAVVTPTPDGGAGDYRVEISFLCPPGTYLYAERVFVDFPAETEISEARFAKGKLKYDKFEEREMEIFTGRAHAVANLRLGSRSPAQVFPLAIAVEYQGCTSEFCYFPQSETLYVEPSTTLSASPLDQAEPGGAAATREAQGAGDGPAAAASDGGEAEIATSGGGVDFANRIASEGLLFTYIGVFASGILLSFTPCVFPIIPITVGVIGAKGAGSLARGFSLSLVYVLGMALTYAALGLFAAQTGALFGSFLQNPFVVGFVALVLTALALSMFGLYEIQIPAALAGRLSGSGSGGGFVGVFFMGIVAGLVASPCVGPVILGLLIFIATTGSALLGFTLLLTLGLGMGMLFLVIGTFSGSLSALPRAGVWMDRVKELFGVLLIGMALYFLRPIAPPLLFAAATGLILLVLAGFGGVFESGSGGWMDKTRRTILIIFLATGIALTGGALRQTGWLLPPTPTTLSLTPSDEERSLEGIAWMESESEGIEAARLARQPVIIDFTADWCLVCHEIDDAVFHDERVIDAAEEFIAIRLDFTRIDDTVRALQSKYGVRGLPLVLFIDREGNVMPELSVSGFVEPEDFLERMELVAAS